MERPEKVILCWFQEKRSELLKIDPSRVWVKSVANVEPPTQAEGAVTMVLVQFRDQLTESIEPVEGTPSGELLRS
jgi:hypothetical protein